MPFTPTHIAAALPVSILARDRLPLSALVIGTQIPDVPLYLPSVIPFPERILHTMEGVFVGCLPLGLLGFLWYQALVREPLYELLPHALRARWAHLRHPYLSSSYRFFLRVLVALGIGAASHALWDSFTHYGNWGYQLIPNMDRLVFELGTTKLARYEVLQYGSTLLLLPLMILGLGYWTWRLPKRDVHPTPLSERERMGWTWLIAIGPLLFAMVWTSHGWVRDAYSARTAAVQLITTLGLVQFLFVTAYACWFRQRHRGLGELPR